MPELCGVNRAAAIPRRCRDGGWRSVGFAGARARPGDGERATSYSKEEQQAEQHAGIGARVVQHVPEPLAWGVQLGKLGCNNGGDNYGQQRKGGEARPQTEDDGCAAQNFDRANDQRHDLRMGIPIFAKRPTPSAAGKRNFWIPSDTKTQPTRIRMRMTARIGYLD